MKNIEWKEAYAIYIAPDDMERTLLTFCCLHNRTRAQHQTDYMQYNIYVRV
jgi:hypothetical protein